MSSVKNDQEAKAKAKASLTLNKVKPFANSSLPKANKEMQATQKTRA